MAQSFWQGKKVFVTGHTGFKGSWLTAILYHLGAEVTGYALKPATSPALFDLLGLAQKIHHIEADVCDRQKLKDAIDQAKPDVVLHLAAQALVRDSYDDPVSTFETNITGTLNFLEALRGSTTCRSAVIVTSDKCYYNDDSGLNFKEEDKLGGKDPYSASKAAAEIVTQSYQQSYFNVGTIAVASARAGNVIGGGDWAKDRLIPDVVRAYQAKQPVIIRSPKATRPWQHVLEPVCGYLALAEKLYTDGHQYASAWNFGPQVQDIQSVETVLQLLQKNISFDLQLDQNKNPVEAKTLGLDITKSNSQLNWMPCLNLEKAVAWTGLWYKDFLDGKNVEAVTMQQITEYLSLIAKTQKSELAA